MKKFILLFVMLLIPTIASAQSACSYEQQADLKDSANLIKFNYEEKERNLDPTENGYYEYLTEEQRAELPSVEYYLGINILNITEDLKVVITNNVTDEERIVNYSDTTDGKYSFDWFETYDVATLTIEVLASNSTPCPEDSLRIDYLTTPMYNFYHTADVCKDYQDEEFCQKYVSISGFDYSIFENRVEKIEKEEEEKEKEEASGSSFDKVIDFISDNSVWFITGGAVIAVGVIIVVIMQRKRSKL